MKFFIPEFDSQLLQNAFCKGFRTFHLCRVRYIIYCTVIMYYIDIFVLGGGGGGGRVGH
jgi:hypothetical protein